MHIKKVTLNNFRNYENLNIDFEENINLLYGNNAQGKTNIIESIFLCAMGKSFRSNKEKELIYFDKENANIDLIFFRENREYKVTVKIENKKTFFINGIKQQKISDIIGKLNVVIFTPDDIEIVKDGPQKRRKFLDMMISSLKPNYMYLLNRYNKVLEQRNVFLKKIKFENCNMEFLDILDNQLSDLSFKIYTYRKYFVEKINENIKVFHKMITKCGQEEEINIKYITNGTNEEKYLESLKKSRDIDLKRGYTATGIHKDDFIIYINQRPVSNFGSQGQQRTSILSLKLAELAIVKEETGDFPVLLLDDFMSELDEKRRKAFMENIKDNQVIITCTDKMENENGTIYKIESGKAYREK